MSLLRILLVFVIGWLVLRMVSVFIKITRGPGGQQSGADPKANPPQHRGPDDFSPDKIKDAEFEDLTPSPKTPPHPPKTP